MNIEELKRLAEAATPGPWVSHPKGYCGAVCRADDQYNLVAVTYGQRRNNVLANEAYIAAANPAAILELIADRDEWKRQAESIVSERDKLEVQRDELLVALKDARELVDGWGAYASNYMQEKHDLAGDLDRLDAAITKGEK